MKLIAKFMILILLGLQAQSNAETKKETSSERILDTETIRPSHFPSPHPSLHPSSSRILEPTNFPTQQPTQYFRAKYADAYLSIAFMFFCCFCALPTFSFTVFIWWWCLFRSEKKVISIGDFNLVQELRPPERLIDEPQQRDEPRRLRNAPRRTSQRYSVDASMTRTSSLDNAPLVPQARSLETNHTRGSPPVQANETVGLAVTARSYKAAAF